MVDAIAIAGSIITRACGTLEIPNVTVVNGTAVTAYGSASEQQLNAPGFGIRSDGSVYYDTQGASTGEAAHAILIPAGPSLYVEN